MGTAVELYVDPASEQALRRLQVDLSDHGIPAVLDQLGFRPHLSLAGFADTPPEAVIEVARRFAGEISSFSIMLSHVGVFPTTEGVVFLAPTVTEHLRHIHTQFHRRLEQVGLRADRYYRPDLWVPHCTVTTDITRQQMAQAVEVLIGAFRPIEVQCTALGVITYRPALLQAQFALAGIHACD